MILIPGSKDNSLAIKLIDYDGMFVPALAGKASGELGHPNYQHPKRLKDGTYNVEVDRFPLLVVATALAVLMLVGPKLWERYDNGDNLLFKESDLRSPAESALFRDLRQIGNSELRSLVERLTQSISQPLEQCPLLGEAVVPTAVAVSVGKLIPLTPIRELTPLTLPKPVDSKRPTRGRSLRGRREKWSRQEVVAGVVAVGMAMLGLLMGLIAWVTWPTGTKTQPRSSLAQSNQEGGEKQKDGSPLNPPADPPRPLETNELPQEITNSIGMQLVRIPAGKFTMGSSKKEQDEAIAGLKPGDALLSLYRSEGPQHKVQVSEFSLGVREVTQKQFRAVMFYNPSHFSINSSGFFGTPYTYAPGGGKSKIPAGEDTEDYPVENVSWLEAEAFCDRLTEKDTTKPAGWGYRLPTEAEWEYACRGGTPAYQVFHFGNSLSSNQANFNGNLPHGGADKAVDLQRTCKVGSYAKNRFGLFDMHGNVWEWCLDWYGEDYYGKSPPKDPSGPSPPRLHRTLRGGSWFDDGQSCRSAHRNWFPLVSRSFNLGFRVALSPNAGDEEPSEEASTIAKLEKLGAKIHRLPGKRVTLLNLSNIRVTDADLKDLAVFKRLTLLFLDRTQVTDAGLKELVVLWRLHALRLRGTRVTDLGMNELRKALPNCDIRK